MNQLELGSLMDNNVFERLNHKNKVEKNLYKLCNNYFYVVKCCFDQINSYFDYFDNDSSSCCFTLELTRCRFSIAFFAKKRSENLPNNYNIPNMTLGDGDGTFYELYLLQNKIFFKKTTGNTVRCITHILVFHKPKDNLKCHKKIALDSSILKLLFAKKDDKIFVNGYFKALNLPSASVESLMERIDNSNQKEIILYTLFFPFIEKALIKQISNCNVCYKTEGPFIICSNYINCKSFSCTVLNCFNKEFKSLLTKGKLITILSEKTPFLCKFCSLHEQITKSAIIKEEDIENLVDKYHLHISKVENLTDLILSLSEELHTENDCKKLVPFIETAEQMDPKLFKFYE